MADQHLLAYLAGSMDADGFFGIKKSTYHVRVRKDAVNAVYSERMGMKQVTPEIPTLLRDTFGGHLGSHRPNKPNGRPLYGWNATDQAAANAAAALEPYVRIKRQQIAALIELRSWRKNRQAHQFAWWWVQEYPDWRTMPMLTARQVAEVFGYRDVSMVSQALRNKTFIALPLVKNSHVEQARFPEPFIRELATMRRPGRGGGKLFTPPQLIATYEALWERCRLLNAIGTGDHPVTMRTGPYALATV